MKVRYIAKDSRIAGGKIYLYTHKPYKEDSGMYSIQEGDFIEISAKHAKVLLGKSITHKDGVIKL